MISFHSSLLYRLAYTYYTVSHTHIHNIPFLSCPQNIAKRGNYGAYLLEQEETLLTLVKHLLKHLHVPLSVKVRLVPPVTEEQALNFDIPQASLNLYTKLVDAGIHLLTIHGRTRHEKGMNLVHADWKTIGKAVELLGDRIPIFANGGIETYDDVQECLRITNADGIMSSESLLEYPPIFYKIPQVPTRTIGRLQLTQEYLALARQYPPHHGGQGSGLKCMRTHVHRFLHADLQDDVQTRQVLISVDTMEGLQQAVDNLQEVHGEQGHDVQQEYLSWYLRHREDPEAVKELLERSKEVAGHELQDDAAECFGSLFGDDDDE
jgi:tRNA-dihydrouridine synthase